MAENSAIEWTHHTFNPWRGCARVSEGCRNCYAETLSKRNPKVLGTWGVDGTRVVASEAYWREPVKWAAAARLAGERHRVFCASLADVGEDRPDLVGPRGRLCELILRTADDLLWLLLTKRPENMARLFPREVLERCGVGTTTENQPEADRRVPLLLRTPAAVRFISAEPLLGPVDLHPPTDTAYRLLWPFYYTGKFDEAAADDAPPCPERNQSLFPRLDWVIVGGESGPGARPMHPDWARALRDQCVAAGVKFFFKQWGEWAPGECAESAVTRTERTASNVDGVWHFESLTPRQSVELHADDAPHLFRLGKKASGRLLDGREWSELPLGS